MTKASWSWIVASSAVLALGCSTQAQDLADQFRDPPDRARMTVYWIWFGPAVTREGIDTDLENMRRARIGGTVLLPMYPLSPDDPRKGIRNLPFLSPEFLDLLGYAAQRSRELGLTFEVTLGTGWPYGGPWITPDLGSQMLRLRGAADAPKPGERRVVTSGDRAVVALPTGMQVKRPALGSEGLVLDHYSRAALDRHLDVAGEKLFEAVREKGARSFWCDSFEVFEGNWTPGVLDHFRRLQGYDLKPLLPLLFGEETPEARQVRHDFWQTLSDMATQNFVKPLQEWCHRKGVPLSMEPYGVPPVSLAASRYVDLPVGECYDWRCFNLTRWTSSGAHLYGRNVVGAEAWTNVGQLKTGEVVRTEDSLERLKLVSDMHFVSGANALMPTGYLNTPPSAGRPGWIGYWGPFISHTQTWWPYFPLLAAYIQRVSFVLQQGRPVNDVALYLPVDDAFAATPAAADPQRSPSRRPYRRWPDLSLSGAVLDLLKGPIPPSNEFGLEAAMAADTPVVSGLIRAGYGFDGIDSSTLPEADVDGGRLRLGLGEYRVVVLPGLTGMPLADLEKLARFVREGGLLVATRRLPDVAYGWKDREVRTETLKALVRDLFAGPTYGRGRAVFVSSEEGEFRAALRSLVEPDLRLEPEDSQVAFVHRGLPDQDFYFVANLGPQEKSLRPTFRGTGKRVERWNPMDGRVSDEWDGELRLEPYGSMILRVTAGTPGAAVRAASRSPSRVVELGGAWTLQAEERPALRLTRLGSWTEEPGLLHFSGTAVYSTTVELPGAVSGRVELDLGDVREIADVWVNGVQAGVAWKRPYRVDVSKVVREGANSVQVKVTNLWSNAVLGMPQPDYAALRAAYGVRFPDPVEWKRCRPLPSGLLGPARLVMSRD